MKVGQARVRRRARKTYDLSTPGRLAPPGRTAFDAGGELALTALPFEEGRLPQFEIAGERFDGLPITLHGSLEELIWIQRVPVTNVFFTVARHDSRRLRDFFTHHESAFDPHGVIRRDYSMSPRAYWTSYALGSNLCLIVHESDASELSELASVATPQADGSLDLDWGTAMVVIGLDRHIPDSLFTSEARRVQRERRGKEANDDPGSWHPAVQRAGARIAERYLGRHFEDDITALQSLISSVQGDRDAARFATFGARSQGARLQDVELLADPDLAPPLAHALAPVREEIVERATQSTTPQLV